MRASVLLNRADRREHLQQRLQFRLRIPLQQRDHIRSGVYGLCDGYTHSSR